jgi:hypothetical protein
MTLIATDKPGVYVDDATGIEHVDPLWEEFQAEKARAELEHAFPRIPDYPDYSGDRLLDGPDEDLFGRPLW